MESPVSKLFLLFSMFPFLAEVVTAIEVAAKYLDEIDHLTGYEKRLCVVTAVRESLDELDSIPGWSDLTEEQRDKALDALVTMTVTSMRLIPETEVPATAKPITEQEKLAKAAQTKASVREALSLIRGKVAAKAAA